jgi:hypothetical protein
MKNIFVRHPPVPGTTYYACKADAARNDAGHLAVSF